MVISRFRTILAYGPRATARWFLTRRRGSRIRQPHSTPCARDGGVNRSLLFAARTAGATEIYRVGGAQAIAVGVDGDACLAIAVPAGEALSLRLSDPRLPDTVGEVFQDRAGVVALVGDEFFVRLFDEDARCAIRPPTLSPAASGRRSRCCSLTSSDKLTRLRLRGLAGASEEFLLAATAQNLRKLVRLAVAKPTLAPSTA